MMQDKHRVNPLHWLIMIIVGVSTLVSPMVLAEELPVSVKAILPENQIIKNAGYYDLLMKPGEKQKLEFEVHNSGDKEVTLKLAIHSAFTGDGGAFDYTRLSKEKDESLKIPLTDIATVDGNVSVPAKGSTKVPIQLNMPDDAFEGIILGAIRVTQVEAESDDKKDNKKSGISIDNKFAYVVAISLRNNDKEVEALLKLKSIGASQVAGRNTVKVQLQNPTPAMISEVTYDAKIYEKNGNDVLHQNKVSNYRVAPNTAFNFPVSWENKAFKAGTYTLKMTANSAKTKQEWVFDQDFTITAEEAKTLNENAAELETDYSKYILYGGIALGILLVLFGVIIVIITRKNKRKRSRRKNRSKSRSSSSTKGKSSKKQSSSKKSGRSKK